MVVNNLVMDIQKVGIDGSMKGKFIPVKSINIFQELGIRKE